MSPFFYRRHWLTALLMLLLSIGAAAASLDARLDRSRAIEGETVALTLSLSGDDSAVPDLTPLKQDFDLLDEAQSTRLEIINGRSSASRDWQITLAPKHSGRIDIPALHAGAVVSAPLSLAVLPASQAAQAAQGAAEPVMLEIAAVPDNPYVQSEVIYTVNVLSRVPLRRASLSDPVAADAIVERLGEDRETETTRGGQTYQAIERRYAIFPQHSGTLTIDPPRLSAQVTDNRGGGRIPFADFDRFFGNTPFAGMDGVFGRSRTLQLQGRRVTFDVRPRPAGATSPWLPAESLNLQENWTPDPPVFRVGEPLTRSVTITAQGVTAAQLPDLALSAAPGIKTYPDKAQVETRAEGDTLMASKTLKTAMVPSRAGDFTLPAIELSWWDTTADQARVAQLPARTVRVLPAAAGASPPVSAAPPQAAGAISAPGEPTPLAAAPAAARGTSDALGAQPRSEFLPRGDWPWIAGLFGVAWLISTALWLRARSVGRRRNGASDTGTGTEVIVQRERAARQAVERACIDNDAGAARRALLDWAAARWPDAPPRRLDDVAMRWPPDAAAILREIDRARYANGVAAWRGDDAWRVLAPMLMQAKNADAGRDHDAALPPLYPHGA